MVADYGRVCHKGVEGAHGSSAARAETDAGAAVAAAPELPGLHRFPVREGTRNLCQCEGLVGPPGVVSGPDEWRHGVLGRREWDDHEARKAGYGW